MIQTKKKDQPNFKKSWNVNDSSQHKCKKNKTKMRKRKRFFNFPIGFRAENENCNGLMQGESQKVPTKWKFTENKSIPSRSAGMCNINNITKTACYLWFLDKIMNPKKWKIRQNFPI